MSRTFCYFKLFFLLSFIVCFHACKGQQKSVSPEKNANRSEANEIKSTDKDPFFITPEALTFFSAYGPTSITRNILKDRKGDIWLATWEGIIQYKENVFTNFTTKEGLRKFHAFCLLEDKKGNIWAGTIGAGVYRYNPNAKPGEKAFTNFSTKNGLVNDKITCIYEDNSGKIWFGTLDGVSVYDPSYAENPDNNPFKNITTDDGLTNGEVNAIYEDKNGIFWFGTRGAACFYDIHNSKSGRQSFTEVTNWDGRSFSNIRRIIEDKNGNIWLGGNPGLWRFDGNSFVQYADDFTGYIFEDRMGNIWTSSEANAGYWKVVCFEAKSLEQNSIPPIEIIAEPGMFFGIEEDKSGGIWIGNLKGVYRYDPATSRKQGRSVINQFKK